MSDLESLHKRIRDWNATMEIFVVVLRNVATAFVIAAFIVPDLQLHIRVAILALAGVCLCFGILAEQAKREEYDLDAN